MNPKKFKVKQVSLLYRMLLNTIEAIIDPPIHDENRRSEGVGIKNLHFTLCNERENYYTRKIKSNR